MHGCAMQLWPWKDDEITPNILHPLSQSPRQKNNCVLRCDITHNAIKAYYTNSFHLYLPEPSGLPWQLAKND